MTTESSFNSTFLHIGDVISLYAEGPACGFMGTMGLVDDRCVVRVGDGSLDKPPKRYRDSLFRLCPISRYQAQNNYHQAQMQFNKSFDSPTADALLLKRLKVAAEKEREQNDLETQKQVGQELTYGSLIQLYHLKSQKFITANMREPAIVERNAIRVYLDSKCDEGSWFAIEPFLKLRSNGDKVVVGDRIRLCPANMQPVTAGGERHQLHISAKPIPIEVNQEGCDMAKGDLREVNCLNEDAISWRTVLYLDYKDYNLDCLKSGDVVRLFHTEQQMFLTLDTYDSKNYIYLRKTARTNALDALNPKALWEVEVVHNDPCKGGAGLWTSRYRFKHMATDFYLAAEQDKSPVHASLQEKSCNVYFLTPGEDTILKTVFELGACTVTQPDAVVPKSAFVRLFHGHSKTWAHSTKTMFDQAKPPKEREMYKVECIQTMEDLEAFSLMPVSVDEVRDLDFANDAFDMIRPFAAKLKVKDQAKLTEILDAITQKERTAITRLIGDLVVFLANGHTGDPLQPDFFQHPLVKPNRDRQKLIREQNVLGAIFEIVKTSQANPYLRAKNEQSDPRVASSWRHMYQLCQVVLRLSQQDYRKTQEFMAKKYFGVLQEEIGLGVRAEDTIAALVNGNPKLLNEMKCIDKKNIETFVRLVKEHRQAKYLDYLSTLCVSRGEAVATIQELVCNEVLEKPENLSLFIKTEYSRDEEGNIKNVVLRWDKGEEEGVIQLPLHTVASHINYREMLSFYEHQLHMYSQMCLGRQYKALQSPISNELPIDLILHCMMDNQLSCSLRAAFTRLMVHLHVDRDPQELVTAIRYAKLWTDIPDSISVDIYDTQEKTYVEGGVNRQVSREQFNQTIRFVETYLRGMKRQGFRNEEGNQLTHEVVLLANNLIHFGFYSLRQLLELTNDLMELLDPNEQTVNQKMSIASQCVPQLVVQGTDGQTALARRDSIFVGGMTRLNRAAADSLEQEAVMKTKLTIIEIFSFVKNLRLDYRVSVVLSLFKQHIQKEQSNDHDGLIETVMRQLVSQIFGSGAEHLAGEMMQQEEWTSINTQGGARLLRVLISLSLETSPALVSGALGLLFRHFAQRQDLLTAFRLLQLLVTDEDRKNYETIRVDLMVIKDLVEKSELWMNLNAVMGEKYKLRQILERLTSLCYKTDSGSSLDQENVDDSQKMESRPAQKATDVPDPRNQQLLRNMRVQEVVLELLSVPYDKADERMAKLIVMAHKFLQAFCNQNKENQEYLHSRVVFGNQMTAGQRLHIDTVEDVRTLCAIFKDNSQLCSTVPESLVRHIVQEMEKRKEGRHVVYLQFLDIICKSEGQANAQTQIKVIQELWSAGDEVLLLFNEPTTRDRLKKLLHTGEYNLNSPEDEIAYHLHLVRLLTRTVEGKNEYTEIKCASLLTLDDIANVMKLKEASYVIKDAYLIFLTHCYIDACADMLPDKTKLWPILGNVLNDVTSLISARNTDYLETYVAGSVCCFLNGWIDKIRSDMQLPGRSQDIAEQMQPWQHHLSLLMKEMRELEQADWTYLTRSARYRIGECVKRLAKVVKVQGLSAPMPQLLPSDVRVSQQLVQVSRALRAGAAWKRDTVKSRRVQHTPSEEYITIMKRYEALLRLLDAQLKPEIDAEFSVLIDVLNQPELLFPPDSDVATQCANGGLLSRLVHHCKQLLHDKHQEALCLRLLQTFQRMILPIYDNAPHSHRVRAHLLERYLPHESAGFNKRNQDISEDDRLCFIQTKLNEAGAAGLLVEIVTQNPKPNFFQETIMFGISLLQGGNTTVQETLYELLKPADSTTETFFAVLNEKFVQAEQKVRGDHARHDSWFMAKPTASPATSALSSRTASFTSASEVIKKPEMNINKDKNLGESRKLSMVDLDSAVKHTGEHEPLTAEVLIMEPVLRFLQLLCENHNCDLQNLLRDQHTKNNYNLVSCTVQLLDCLCGSTPGSLGLLGYYINEDNVNLITQAIISLTEYCQGPCHANQDALLNEASGLDMIISLLLNEITPLCTELPDLVMDIKSNASILLLAIMESRVDTENAERILSNMSRLSGGPQQLIASIKAAYHQDNVQANVEQSLQSRKMGHNMYILAKQLSQHNIELARILEPQEKDSTEKLDAALEHYGTHTAQIEIVREEGVMERIVFPVPDKWKFLTPQTKSRVYRDSELDKQGSKVRDFVSQFDSMYVEMKWQQELKSKQWLNPITENRRQWQDASYFFAIVINVIVAYAYPFDFQNTTGHHHHSVMEFPYLRAIDQLMWPIMFIVLTMAYKHPCRTTFFWFCISFYLRILLTCGIVTTVYVLGFLQLMNKLVQLISYCGNAGIFAKYRTEPCYVRLLDVELLVLVASVALCAGGLFITPLWHSLLLFDIVYREETLINVIRSVTRNWRSIAWTAMLALILMYVFAIVIFVLFPGHLFIEQDDAAGDEGQQTCAADSTQCKTKLMTKDSEGKTFVCNTLFGCLVETINCGLKGGGGVGDCLQRPTPGDPQYHLRIMFDLSFFIVIVVIVLNLIFGVIIDTFADLRSEKQQKEDVLENSCFVCGLTRQAFEHKTVTFEKHIEYEHNPWQYFYFWVQLLETDPTEYNGPQSYVYDLMKDPNRKLEWFPRLKAMSLEVKDDSDPEQSENRKLQRLLRANLQYAQSLQQQMTQMRRQMLENRHQLRERVPTTSGVDTRYRQVA